ncbi:sulfatase [Bacteroidota bacterium]
MKHKSLGRYALGISILCMTMIFASCREETKQPNIVVFLCDDLGYGDLSCFGHPIIKTPNLDKMASAGIKLTSCYSSAPVCSPSRVGLLTGRSPNRAGVYDWIPEARNETDDLRDLVHMQKNEITIPSILKSVGYTTCLVGKWHCNSKFNSVDQPQPGDFGFDHWLATQNNASPSHENPNNFVRNGEPVGQMTGYSCQLIVDEAIEWLNKKKDSSPFYLQVTFHEPHEPVASPPALVQKYLPESISEDQAQYFANVANVDKAVGRLIKVLEEKGLDNTLVVFTSDNGPETLDRYRTANRSHGRPGKLKGMKLWTHEAGFRVPGIIYWTGKSKFSGVVDEPVSALDFLPTFCELAGTEIPERNLDGTSFVPLLNGKDFDRKKPLLWCYYNALNEHMVAMRDGEWKIMARLKNDTSYIPKAQNIYKGNESLIRSAELVDYSLYNLIDDLSETRDVSQANPEIFEALKASIKDKYGELIRDTYVWER